MNPTMTRPLFAMPAIPCSAMRSARLFEMYMQPIAKQVTTIDTKKIHFLPILSAAKGMNKIVEAHPTKYMLPMSPI